MVLRHLTHLRLAAASIVLAVGLLIASSGAALAQGAPCVCSTIRIDIDNDVRCAVTICYRVSPSGPTICVAVQPGASLTIPCADWEDACIRLCNGGCQPLMNPAADSKCTPTLQVGPVCCVRACRVQSAAEKCPHIEVSPVALCLGEPCN